MVEGSNLVCDSRNRCSRPNIYAYRIIFLLPCSVKTEKQPGPTLSVYPSCIVAHTANNEKLGRAWE